MIEYIVNAIIYFALCFTLPHVCIVAAFESKSKYTKVNAIIAFAAFIYLGLYCMNFR